MEEKKENQIEETVTPKQETLKSEDLLKKSLNLKIKSFPFQLIAVLIVGLIIFLVTNFGIKDYKDAAYYYFLGGVVGMFGFSLIVRTINSTIVEKLKVRLTVNYIIRYILYAIVLGFSYFGGGAVEMIFAASGIVTLKIVLISYNLIKRGEQI